MCRERGKEHTHLSDDGAVRLCFVSPDNTLMPTVWITYHATVEEELMENLSLWHLHIHKTRQPAA